ncbi:MAG TPA: ABC transporter substrate-binding protein, partial [Burkholderiales bacterium]|nr:ABC transporter substrate-binding protein [Burkholderiales bacterium]
MGLLDAGKRLWWWKAFTQKMRELGYVEGKSVRYETRYGEGYLDRLSSLARDLVQRQVAVIVTAATAATQAAKDATSLIPIVSVTGAGHVSMGFAESLAKPGGNVTGLTSLSADLTFKRVELLRELFPRLSRLAVLWQTNNSGSTSTYRDLEHATELFKIKLQNVGIRKKEELPNALATAAKARAEAVYVISGPLTVDERVQIAALALQHHLPSIYSGSDAVEIGAFISYGVHYADLFVRAATYVDRILKGAKPGDLPIEQPTRFELVLNMKTAKALGITIPQSILLRT